MVMRKNFMAAVAVMMVLSMLLSACGGAEATATTAPSAAAPTDTTAAAAPTNTTAAAAPTNTTAAMAGETPTAAGAMTGTSAFDPTKYKKNAIEANATLRVSSWGDSSEQGVNKAALARFSQVYPDVKITY